MMQTLELKAFYELDIETQLVHPDRMEMHETFLSELEAGSIRAAQAEHGQWKVNSWVKKAILTGFRLGQIEVMPSQPFSYFDKSTFPARQFSNDDGVRLVPGGSSVRRGSFIGKGVVLMPPAYVNVGAYVGENSMIDSHALVGSCAQVGRHVHVSAAAQIGGVLEPVGARPVIVEDEAFIGGLAGLFEGVIVRKRAVIAAGVVLTAATPIWDEVHQVMRKGEVPEAAVVVPATRPYGSSGYHVSCAMIVKYRDEKTDASTVLEGVLR